MALFIQKFGGTSVGSIERIKAIAERVIRTRQAGHQVVVVVSAMSGETDRLLSLAKEMMPQPKPREYAAILATGEQVSSGLTALALCQHGVTARSFTGTQIGLRTDNQYEKARIEDIDTELLKKELAAGHVPVVAGFQGVASNGDITTLGRGGSDTTAVALAAALKADECQIYTDVDGVYTTDPRVVPEARRLNQITFEEMLELASLGAKVLQIRSVEFVGKYHVPLRVLSSFVDGPGTLITFEDEIMEKPLVSGIAFNRNEAKLTIMGVPALPGVPGKIIQRISDAHIDIDMIIQNIAVHNTVDFTFTVNRTEYTRARELLEKVCQELGGKEVVGDPKIVKISLVGVGMRSHPGIASQMFSTLGQEGINIHLISTSEIKISVVVDEKYLELGVRALHTAFSLSTEPQQEFDPQPVKKK